MDNGLNNSQYDFRFGGISRLIGPKAFSKLKSTHVCVMGIGGVGSWAAESLVRSGIGKITLVDLDDICLSNVNRQVHAIDGNVGMQKIEALELRLLKINPEVEINLVLDFYDKTTTDKILNADFNYVIDAIDSLKNKALLVSECTKRKIPVLVSGAAGGKFNPTMISTSDIGLAGNDMMIKKLRKVLRREYGIERDNNDIFGVECVFSHERAVYPGEDGEPCPLPPKETGAKLDCESGFGSSSFITGTFGFHAAHWVLKQIAKS